MPRVTRLTIAAAAAFAVAVPAQAQAAPTLLNATVGPGFTITLKTAAGKQVKTLKPGTYRIAVNDLSGMHNFALRGPGVAKATSVPWTGSTTWAVKLKKGTYTFVCDPHASTMRGTFKVK